MDLAYVADYISDASGGVRRFYIAQSFNEGAFALGRLCSPLVRALQDLNRISELCALRSSIELSAHVGYIISDITKRHIDCTNTFRSD